MAISCGDNAENDFYVSFKMCTVCETNTFVGEISKLNPDKAFLSRYLLLHQLLLTKHYIESILSYHGMTIERLIKDNISILKIKSDERFIYRY